jgi:uncharacterized protein YyaL (SSP411 family)
LTQAFSLVIIDHVASSPFIVPRIGDIVNRPTVYVCEYFTCAPPVAAWEELEPLLRAEG